MIRKHLQLVVTIGLSLTVIGCGNTLERISRVGDRPPLSPIENPNASELYQPVSLPMPDPVSDVRQPASLWRQGSRAFFKDQRAGRVGDILTVVIEIDDEAELDNSTSRARTAGESAGLDNLLGYESRINNIFDGDALPTNLVNADSDSSSTGTGSTQREEEIDLRMAAIITQVLPNGNFVIQGSQQVRVNYELRDLQVKGIIRPEDITSLNEVPYDKIAEARISYGGAGTISDVQQPRYGQQVFDILFPF
ncbi:flagellar basal body L-ring protein FlgH [Dongia deserti]|uniref:flagellar basal body L-ring protein FlgH n=1 Tax=Dongia deserti TaxID=2268030 RepID=UPI000E64E09E|nr:flagellar basal body L-ring protein FlgH [Dongia deserti]